MNGEAIQLALEVFTFICVVILGAVWLRSQLAKQRVVELAELAETRGDRIQDLEAKVKQLTTEMHEMRGQMKLLVDLKTEEIIEGVVVRLIPFLQSTHGDEH
jgi:hypothetical protein